MLTSTVCLIGPCSKNHPYFSHIWACLFFYLNPCFLANSKLITSPVVLLFNNAFTIIPYCVSILSNPIFTVTSLKRSSLSKLYEDVFSATLESIANLLLLLRSNWDSLDLCSHLNYYYCPSLASFFCSSLFPYFCSFLPYVQNLHMYNNSSSYLCS